MPQNCQIIGANSVTNIEPGKGVMPAPIIRNADWSEIFAYVPCSAWVSSTSMDAQGRQKVHAKHLRILVTYLYRIVANCRFTSGGHPQRAFKGWMASLFI